VIVGLVFAGIGATVIAFGTCFLMQATCTDCDSEQSRRQALNHEATYLCPGVVSSIEELTPDQVAILHKAFDEPANDSFELRGGRQGERAKLWVTLNSLTQAGSSNRNKFC